MNSSAASIDDLYQRIINNLQSGSKSEAAATARKMVDDFVVAMTDLEKNKMSIISPSPLGQDANPQNPKERPLMLLRDLMHDYPYLSDLVNIAMELRERFPREYWPEWCFIPRQAWFLILERIKIKDTRRTVKNEDEELSRLATIGTWRYGQGIYTFEPEIYNALLESDIPEKLPSDVLLRLPEWSIYVPTPNTTFYGNNIYGFFASLDFKDKRENDAPIPYLFLSLDINEGPGINKLHTIPIPLTNNNLLTILTTTMAKKTNKENDLIDILGGKDFIANIIKRMITPLISLLLYICGNEPEIDNEKKPGTPPLKPQTRKIKGVYKVFPATNPVVWTIGKKISETLRNIDREYAGGSKIGGQKRPHFRKGHHNYYWTGPRNTEQTQILKWIPPKLVAQRTEEKPKKNDKPAENTSDNA